MARSDETSPVGRNEENLAWRAMSFAEESSPEALRQRADIINVAVMAARLRYGDALDTEETGLLAGYARRIRAQAADKDDPEGRAARTAAHADELRNLAAAIASRAARQPARWEDLLARNPERIMASMAADWLEEAAADLTGPDGIRANAFARLDAAQAAAAGEARYEHAGREVCHDGIPLAWLISKHKDRLAGLLTPDEFAEAVNGMTKDPSTAGPDRAPQAPARPGPARTGQNTALGTWRRPGPADSARLR